MSKKSIKKKLNLLFFLALALSFSFVSAFNVYDDLGTGITIISSKSNSSITTNSSFDKLQIEENWLEIYNLSGTGYFENVNESFNAFIHFYGSVNSLSHNGTSLCNGSSSNINSNDGNINITLNPNEPCYVLNEFNLTEGVTRENSPLNITLTSTFMSEAYNSKTYHISSTLNDIINTTVIINSTSCPSAGDTIKLISNTGVPNLIDSNNYVCEGNLIILNVTGIEQASNSNELIFTYNKDPIGGGGSGSTGSDTTNLSLNVSGIICNESYYFILQHLDSDNNLIYSDLELSSLAGKISTKYSLFLSSEQVKPYVDNFVGNCYNLTNLRLPTPKKKLPILNITIFDFPECTVELNNSFFDFSIPFFRVYQGSMTCDSLNFWRFLFKFEKIDENYALTGIRLYWIALIIVSLLFIKFLRESKSFKKYEQ